MIPYLNMNCRIVIGEVRFENCNRIEIEEDITDIGDTAIITLPKNFKRLKDKAVLEYIKAGDKVSIQWGYNGNYSTQFEGYVRRIGAEAPLVIDCDDAWYPLKRNQFVKSYLSVSLKKLLQDIMPGYEVECPDVQVGKFPINAESSYQIIKRIQRDNGFYIRLVGKKIIVAFAHKWKPIGRKVYDRQINVKKSDLEWRRKEDVNIKVDVEYEEKGVKKVVSRTNVGNDMQLVKKETVNVGIDKKGAEELANAKLNQYAFDGFAGSITGFGVPDTHVGEILEIRDARSPDKNGQYIIEKVVAEYAQSHISRRNYPGRKL